MSTATAQLFAEIRDSARNDLECLELQTHLEGDDAPTEEELAVIAQIRKAQELLILTINAYLDE